MKSLSIGVIAATWLLGSLALAQTPTATETPSVEEAPKAPEKRVRIRTDAGSIEGVLLDRLPQGYLIKTDDGTQVIAYDAVREFVELPAENADPVEVVVPVAETPPAPTPTVKAKEAWPAYVTIGYVFGLQPRRRSTALGRTNPDGTATVGSLEPDSNLAILTTVGFPANHWMSVEFDFLIDTTRTELVPDGQDGCSLWLAVESGNNCATFNDGVWYDSVTMMMTLWVRPYYSLGSARIWGGVGANLALVTSSYDAEPFGNLGYGSSKDTVFSVSFGAGVDARLPVGKNASLIGSLGLVLGSPVYDERIDDLFVDGFTWDTEAVGHAVNAWRLNMSIGVAFPTRKKATP